MIEDAIRNVFWAIAKLFLSASDWMYEMLISIVDLDLSSAKIIRYSWLFMLFFLTFACFVRIAFVLMKKNANDEDPLDVGKLGKKIVGVFIVVAVAPTCFYFSLGLPKAVNEIYTRVITYDSEMTPSTAVISATAKTPITASLTDMSESDEVIDIETIDDKLNDEESGQYIYFYSLSELILSIVGSYIVLCVQVNIISDCASRIFINIFRFIIGFIPISSMVEEESMCGEWARDITSDAIVVVCSLIFTKVVFGLMATSEITELNGVVRIGVFAIALMAVSKTGEIISKYMGASNLSNGGRVGSMLLGVGAMAAMRGASKVIGKGAKSIWNTAKHNSQQGYETMADAMSGFGGDSGNDNLQGGGDPMIPGPGGGSGDGFGNTLFGSGGSGDSFGSTIFGSGGSGDPQDSYFVNSGLNNDTMQSSQDLFINQGDGSLLDCTPTSTQFADDSGVSSAINPTLGQDGTQRFNDGLTINQETGSSQQDYDTKLNGFTIAKDFDALGGSGGFIDTYTRGHMFKGADMAYKPSIRETLEKRPTLLNGEILGDDK